MVINSIVRWLPHHKSERDHDNRFILLSCEPYGEVPHFETGVEHRTVGPIHEPQKTGHHLWVQPNVHTYSTRAMKKTKRNTASWSERHVPVGRGAYVMMKRLEDRTFPVFSFFLFGKLKRAVSQRLLVKWDTTWREKWFARTGTKKRSDYQVACRRLPRCYLMNYTLYPPLSSLWNSIMGLDYFFFF